MQFSKKYKNPLEEKTRMLRFQKVSDEISKHNKEFEEGKHSFKMSHNAFSDLSKDELSAKLMHINPKDIHGYEGYERKNTSDRARAPASFSWVDKGWNTAVANQESCGSCYSFAAVGTIEAAYYIQKKQTIKLSQQDPVDCSSRYGNQGCNGGMPTQVYQYCKAQGISMLSRYPYRGSQSICRKSGSKTKIRSYSSISRGDENALKEAVANHGPVSVAIDVPDSWTRYSGGVYYDPACKRKVEHAVIVVGYGSANGMDYWLVKNSWGANWGENGYIRMARNRNDHCGIADYAAYPSV